MCAKSRQNPTQALVFMFSSARQGKKKNGNQWPEKVFHSVRHSTPSAFAECAAESLRVGGRVAQRRGFGLCPLVCFARYASSTHFSSYITCSISPLVPLYSRQEILAESFFLFFCWNRCRTVRRKPASRRVAK